MSYTGSIDLSTLPDDLNAAVQSRLTEDNLSKISRAGIRDTMSEIIAYELRYENSDQIFSIDESQANPELLELIDSLKPYLRYEKKTD